MTIVLSIPSQQYTPQTITAQTPVVPAGTRRMRVTFSRESRPPGHVGSLGLAYPDGTIAGSATFSGGDLYVNDTNPKQLSTVPLAGYSLLQEDYFEISSATDLPTGKYTAVVVIAQTITCSVKVERF